MTVGSLSRCPAPGLAGPGALATRGLQLPQASEHRGGEEGEGEEGHSRALVLPPPQERLTGAGDKRRTCGWPCGPLSGLHPLGCRVSAETLLSARLPACAWPPRQALGRGEGRPAGLTRWGGRGQATWPRGFWTVIGGSVRLLHGVLGRAGVPRPAPQRADEEAAAQRDSDQARPMLDARAIKGSAILRLRLTRSQLALRSLWGRDEGGAGRGLPWGSRCSRPTVQPGSAHPVSFVKTVLMGAPGCLSG